MSTDKYVEAIYLRSLNQNLTESATKDEIRDVLEVNVKTWKEILQKTYLSPKSIQSLESRELAKMDT